MTNKTIFKDEFSKEVWETTYKHHTDVTVEDTFRRVANAVASVESNKELREEWEGKFFDMLSDFRVTCGGRIYSNAGTEFHGTTLMNCFVGPKPTYDQDSLEGIIQTLLYQAKTLKSEGGWGMNFSFIRPRGAFIHGIGVETPGSVKYMELFDKTSDIITAGSGLKSRNAKSKGKIRKGAMMGVLWCWHPDIQEFIDAKLTEGRLTKFNISVGCSDSFMDKVVALKEAIARDDKDFVAEHDKWELVFPDTQFDRYKKEWDGDIEAWKEKGYPIKVWKTVSALGLWDQIMRSTYTRNDPGVLFLDRANKTHCWNYGGPASRIHASNPCVAPETLLLTRNGYRVISSLVGQGVEVWNGKEWSKTVVKKTGTNQPLLKVILRNGMSLDCTPYHKWYVDLNNWVIGSNGSKDSDIVMKLASELKPGDKIHVCDRYLDHISASLVEIEQVLDLGRVDDTYCVNEPLEHKAVFNGILTGQCGEQMLPFGSVCNLASLNLTQFINEKKTGFDLERVSRYVGYAVRFLDDVNDYTNAPLEQYAESIKNRRRIGLGIMGWGSALYLLKVPFASDKAEQIKKKLMQAFTTAAIEASIGLAKEKGAFKDCDPKKHSEAFFWEQIGLDEKLVADIRKHGIRNSALFSIQPTGNTSIYANIVSGGLEPVFMPEYVRTVIVSICPDDLKPLAPKYWEGEFKETDTFKMVKEGTDDVLRAVINGVVYKIDRNRGLTKEVPCIDYGVRMLKQAGEWDGKAEWAKTALSLSVNDHVKDMIGWGKWIDSSMSKTVNCPADYPYDKFESLYLDAYKSGFLKGITTYRAGTMTTVLSEKVETKVEEGKIKKTRAPKRPDTLPCSVEHMTIKGHRYYAVVGLLDGDPYEVFAGSNHDSEGEPIIPKTVVSGEAVKSARGSYKLKAEGVEYPFSKGSSDASVDALTRMISTSLRHGADISFVVHQLEKTKGDMLSFAKVLSRALKKSIKNGSPVYGESCPSCAGQSLVREDGCVTCKDCGWTKCA